MNVLCIDVGNTTTHYGLVQDGCVNRAGDMSTAALDESDHVFAAFLKEYKAPAAPPEGISICSVVPEATMRLMALIIKQGPQSPVFQLTSDKCKKLVSNYPKPEEIGQDRLANAIGAMALYEPPIVVIDIGTAVTFDILTRQGYEGGIIAPGMQMMSRCLHEQTALLPEVELNELAGHAAFGKSTEEAIRIGCSDGFKGMVRVLYDNVCAELALRQDGEVTVVTTGSGAEVIPEKWIPGLVRNRHLTLLGLALAFERDNRLEKPN